MKKYLWMAVLFLVVFASLSFLLLRSGPPKSIRPEVAKQNQRLHGLIQRRVDITNLRDEFGEGQVFTETEAVDLIKRHSFRGEKEKNIEKALKYRKLLYYLPTTDITLFVFLDTNGIVSDYAIGGQ